PLIVFTKDTNTRRILDTSFRELGVTPSIAMELPNFATIKPLVEINLGISILPLSSVVAEVKTKRLHVIRLREKKLHREIGLVYLKAEFLPRAVAELIRQFEQTRQ
ncbi:MAG: LysR family transcriptional regulator substrate-binding protein, partial [Terriglobia bacterium]